MTLQHRHTRLQAVLNSVFGFRSLPHGVLNQIADACKRDRLRRLDHHEAPQLNLGDVHEHLHAVGGTLEGVECYRPGMQP